MAGDTELGCSILYLEASWVWCYLWYFIFFVCFVLFVSIVWGHFFYLIRATWHGIMEFRLFLWSSHSLTCVISIFRINNPLVSIYAKKFPEFGDYINISHFYILPMTALYSNENSGVFPLPTSGHTGRSQFLDNSSWHCPTW